jgi:hypothetical protein
MLKEFCTKKWTLALMEISLEFKDEFRGSLFSYLGLKSPMVN